MIRETILPIGKIKQVQRIRMYGNAPLLAFYSPMPDVGDDDCNV
jgi:hypothetical protein